ncbi:MAG: S1 family peptidase [Nocardioides sp.]|nr:S1 family peptidase [Nocardioides sp.]
MFSVDIDEAVRRLAVQDDAGDLNRELTETFPDTFGGLWMDHGSERLSVLVGATQVSDEFAARVNSRTYPVTILRTSHSVADLVALAEVVARQLQPALAADVSVSHRDGRLLVDTTNEALPLVRTAIAAVPNPQGIEIAVRAHQSVSQPARAIYAGPQMVGCTSGFTVRNSSTGALGITTAAHCADNQTVTPSQPPITVFYQNGLLSGNHDVQWHGKSSSTSVENYAYDGLAGGSTPYYRVINEQAGFSEHYEDRFLCKYGRTQGYDCGLILSVNYCPSYVTNCTPNLIEIDLNVDPGDSGGPVMEGAQGFGLVSGFTAVDHGIYMRINYISTLGLSILTS